MAPYEIASSAIPPRNDKTEILKQVERDIALQCLLIVDSRMTG